MEIHIVIPNEPAWINILSKFKFTLISGHPLCFLPSSVKYLIITFKDDGSLRYNNYPFIQEVKGQLSCLRWSETKEDIETEKGKIIWLNELSLGEEWLQKIYNVKLFVPFIASTLNIY